MNDTQSFEQKIDELEDIIVKLENNELSLDDTVKLYESGIKIAEDCKGLLEKAELEVIKVSESQKEEINDND